MLEDVSGHISEHAAKQILAEAGVPTVDEELVDSADDAVAAAERLGYPVILKVDSADVQHKTDIGGVMDAHTADEVRDRYERVVANTKKHHPDADINGVLVEQQLDGHELIVGVNRDPDFGHVIMFGLGGIFVEVLRDVHFRVVPITRDDARDLIDEMQTRGLLEGVRGEAPADLASIVDVLVTVSEFVDAHPQIKELDINPLFVDSQGAVAADALLVVEDDADE